MPEQSNLRDKLACVCMNRVVDKPRRGCIPGLHDTLLHLSLHSCDADLADLPPDQFDCSPGDLLINGPWHNPKTDSETERLVPKIKKFLPDQPFVR